MRYLFLAFIMLFSFSAQAAPDVEAALFQWVRAVEARDPAKVVELYDKNAIFFSVFAVQPMKTQDERLAYYRKVSQEENIHIDIDESHPHVFGNVAVNSGLYTFHYSEEGEEITVHARFSFTYLLEGGKWVIIDHHSSKVPGNEK